MCTNELTSHYISLSFCTSIAQMAQYLLVLVVQQAKQAEAGQGMDVLASFLGGQVFESVLTTLMTEVGTAPHCTTLAVASFSASVSFSFCYCAVLCCAVLYSLSAHCVCEILICSDLCCLLCGPGGAGAGRVVAGLGAAVGSDRVPRGVLQRPCVAHRPGQPHADTATGRVRGVSERAATRGAVAMECDRWRVRSARAADTAPAGSGEWVTV